MALDLVHASALDLAKNPATGLRSQAIATMQKFADEFDKSLAANGYQKLPSGLIIQWGEFGHNGGSTVATINFPISFASWRSSPVAIRAKGDGNFDASSVLTVDRNVVGALPLANFTAIYQGSARSFAYICIGQ